MDDESTVLPLDSNGNPLVEPSDFPDHFIDPFEITSSSIMIPIGILTLIIYSRLLSFHWNHGFKTHYQKIFFVCATNDIILHYVVLFRVRLPTWGVHEWYWFVRDGFFPSALGYLNALCVQLQVIGTLLIAINRATSLAFPHLYDKFWSQNTWRSCLIAFLLPFLYTISYVTNNSYFQRGSWGFYIPYDDPTNQITAFLKDFNFPLCVGLVCICLIVNIYTCVKLYTYSKEMKRNGNHREFIFHIATVVQFLAQLINTIDLIITNTLPMEKFWFFYEFSPFFSDFANFMPIWFLLLISEETRMMVSGVKERDTLFIRTAPPSQNSATKSVQRQSISLYNNNNNGITFNTPIVSSIHGR